MKSGQIANNTFFLAFRNVVGFGIATTAILLVIDPAMIPSLLHSSFSVWLIPVLAAYVLPSQVVNQRGRP